MEEPTGPINEEAARRNIKRIMTVYAISTGTLIVLSLVAIVVSLLRMRTSHAHSYFAIIALGIVILAALAARPLVYWRLTRSANRRLLQYSWARRRQATQVLQQGRGLDERDRPVVDALMYANRNWHRVIWFFVVVAGLTAIDAGFQHGAHRALAVVWTLCFLLFIPIVIRQQRRMRRNYDRIVRAEAPPDPTE